MIIYISIFMIRHCVTGNDPGGRSMLRKSYFIVCVLFKIAIQILICVQVEYAKRIVGSLAIVPVWLLLVALIVDVSLSVIRRMWPSCDVHVSSCSCRHVVCKGE